MSETNPSADAAESAPVPEQVTAPASTEPAVRLFIMAAMLLGIGLWCLYDGYFTDQFKSGPPDELNPYLNYAFNRYGPFVFIPVGLVFLVLGLLGMRKTIVADQEGIGYEGKARIPWSNVTGMDASKLKDKGILKLHYHEGGGKVELVLDSYKLKNFKELVRLVEAKVSAE